MPEGILRDPDATQSDFDTSVFAYNEQAEVQKNVAGRLINSLNPWKETLPPGPVIELGCGTGFVSRRLPDLFPNRELIFTDSASRMVDFTRDEIGAGSHYSFETLNAEMPPVHEPTYALAISSFAAQWFQDPAYTLGQWLEVIKPGGLLLAAFPGSESFPEWKEHVQTLGLPFTGNTLPDTEEMVIKLSSGGTQVDYYEDTITQRFKRAANFFRHLKDIGAGKQLKGRSLSAKEMRLLMNHWDNQSKGEIAVSYHIVFLAVKKNFNN